MSGSGREALPDIREWSGLSPGCPGVVGIISRMSGSGRGPSWMSGSSQKAFPDVREWSGGPPGCPAVVERPSQMSGSDRKALPDVRA